MEVFGKNLLLQERLGVGGMGEIFRARLYGRDGFTKTVAVKRIKPELTSQIDFRKMFHREANFAARLNHPNIVQVFSNGTSQNCLYIVMEYVHGVNLRQLIKKHQASRRFLPLPLVMHIIAEAAKGLAYAHELKDLSTGSHYKLVHKDVSPHNIMLGFAGEVKLVDFGIAQTTQDSNAIHARASWEEEAAEESRSGTIKGKIAYMSPEQLSGLKLDGRSDIFGLGVVLWEMLTVRRLFSRSRNVLVTDQSEIKEPSEVNKHVPDELNRIVMKALSKDVQHRYQSAAALHDDLVRCLHQHFPQFSGSQYQSYIGKVFEQEVVEADTVIKQSHEEIKRLFGEGIPEPVLNQMGLPAESREITGQTQPPNTTKSVHPSGQMVANNTDQGGQQNSFFGSPIKPKVGPRFMANALSMTKLLIPQNFRMTKGRVLRLVVVMALHYYLIGIPTPSNYLTTKDKLEQMVETNFKSERRQLQSFSLKLDRQIQSWSTDLGVQQNKKSKRFFYDVTIKLEQLIFGEYAKKKQVRHKRKIAASDPK